MKTLEQIKNDYAIGIGYKDWYDLYKSCVFKINEFEKHTDKVCKISQMECLKLASENAMLDWKFIPFEGYTPFVNKKSIANVNNLVK